MKEFKQSSAVWQSLPRGARQRVTAALAASEYTWRFYHLHNVVTREQIDKFARENLFRGFFDKTGLVVATVSAARQADDNGWELKIGCIRHPTNVTLPVWATDMDDAVRIVFKGATRSGKGDIR